MACAPPSAPASLEPPPISCSSSAAQGPHILRSESAKGKGFASAPHAGRPIGRAVRSVLLLVAEPALELKVFSAVVSGASFLCFARPRLAVRASALLSALSTAGPPDALGRRRGRQFSGLMRLGSQGCGEGVRTGPPRTGILSQETGDARQVCGASALCAKANAGRAAEHSRHIEKSCSAATRRVECGRPLHVSSRRKAGPRPRLRGAQALALTSGRAALTDSLTRWSAASEQRQELQGGSNSATMRCST